MREKNPQNRNVFAEKSNSRLTSQDFEIENKYIILLGNSGNSKGARSSQTPLVSLEPPVKKEEVNATN